MEGPSPILQPYRALQTYIPTNQTSHGKVTAYILKRYKILILDFLQQPQFKYNLFSIYKLNNTAWAHLSQAPFTLPKSIKAPNLQPPLSSHYFSTLWHAKQVFYVTISNTKQACFV